MENTNKNLVKTRVVLGDLSNLITDMTLKGATADELNNAISCSAAVLDANKNGDDCKGILDKYGIKDLKKKYQSNK